MSNLNSYNALYQIADECRQTSDDLSKMARLYVLTGNKRYETFYHKIVSIRKGVLPLPINYNEIYWDLVVVGDQMHTNAGKAISFHKRIEDQPMTQEQKDLLKLSLSRGEKLGELEEEAMYARQGLFKNAAGLYRLKAEPNPRLARRLISDSTYIKLKAEALKPLQDFYNNIDQMIDKQMSQSRRQARGVIFLSLVSLIALASFTYICLRKAIHSLTKVSQSNENLLLSALPPAISERLKHGKESSIKECVACVLFLDIGMEPLEKGHQESSILHSLYGDLDSLVEAYKVERIKTLQGNYMVASGISQPSDTYLEDLADFALAAKDKIERRAQECHVEMYIQAGMAFGTVITGVLDHKKYIYDLWGDVLKVASSLETHGVKGEIQISKALEAQLKKYFVTVSKDSDEGVFFLRERINE